MEKYGLNQLRKMFLDFFASKEGFMKLDSASLIPNNDKSLLLINSGMAPLKPYFTGQETPPSTRVTTCQKCIRTPDIENVGKTARHGTFFEMLGNFSFGDYFKREAITWAWEFMTEVVKIDKNLLYVTVYEDDDEAVELWKEIAHLEDKRIVRMGKEDNFWEIGTGPCGPCSEIYVDRGAEYGCGKPGCYVGCDCDRYVEVWNLVFTQFDRDDAGNYNRLAHPNIDTGMGLERLAVVCQGVNSLFEVDTIRYVLDSVCALAGITYGESAKNDVSVRVITDHIRSVVFMLSDGVIPANEGRGYVLRRLLRRAVRHGKLLGITKSFLCSLAEKVIETSSEAYPELKEHSGTILKMIEVEEARFNDTIEEGNAMLSDLVKKLKAEGIGVISGSDAFKLYDTFGFPVDLTKEIAEEEGLDVDEAGFSEQMAIQKKNSLEAYRRQGIGGWKDELALLVKSYPATNFIGYDNLEGESEIICLIKDLKTQKIANEGDNIMFVADTTPFYAQSGGQMGDEGVFETSKAHGRVTDTIKNGDKYIHVAHIDEGSVNLGDKVKLVVDFENRMDSQRNHTATHLLHKALKTVLGEHVNQAGSEVSAEKLRFDFTHFEKMTDQQLEKVETLVNEQILKCIDVEWFNIGIDEAKKMGATALFGEKYGKVVRVVKAGDYSMELCGGCHLKNTGFAGQFKLLSESGVAAGVRRIEALTGSRALMYMKENQVLINKTASLLKTTSEMIPEKIAELENEKSKLVKELNTFKTEASKGLAEGLLSKKTQYGGSYCIVSEVEDADMNELRELSDKLRDKLTSGVVFLCSKKDDKGFMLCAATKDVVETGFNCGGAVKKIAASVGSGGGGRADMAQAGIKDITQISLVAANADCIIKEMLENCH